MNRSAMFAALFAAATQSSCSQTQPSAAPARESAPPAPVAVAAAPDSPASFIPAAAAAAAPAAKAAAPAALAAPVAWTVDSAHSKIAFSGRAPEGPFEGSFAKWSADIRFSPEALARSKASVTIQVNSVNLPDPTGVAALKGADWFDVAAHPTATFVTTAMRRLSGDKYEADGMLTIRGKAQAVKLPFTLSIAGDVATMSGALSVDRAAFGVGEKYGDDTVSKAIKIAIAVRATR